MLDSSAFKTGVDTVREVAWGPPPYHLFNCWLPKETSGVLSDGQDSRLNECNFTASSIILTAGWLPYCSPFL